MDVTPEVRHRELFPLVLDGGEKGATSSPREKPGERGCGGGLILGFMSLCFPCSLEEEKRGKLGFLGFKGLILESCELQFIL